MFSIYEHNNSEMGHIIGQDVSVHLDISFTSQTVVKQMLSSRLSDENVLKGAKQKKIHAKLLLKWSNLREIENETQIRSSGNRKRS